LPWRPWQATGISFSPDAFTVFITYDSTLVLTSIVVAVLASYVALHLAGRVSVARGQAASLLWLAGGATSMGMGIWSMHFVGMLGSDIGIPMAYAPWWTLLSLVLAVTVSGFALFLVRRPTLERRTLLGGGTVMGVGIASMHYAGMAAMQISPAVRFEPLLVGLSVLVGVSASCIALALFVKLRTSALTHPLLKRAGSALVMGVAIAGMHYTGMAAAGFSPGSICTVPAPTVSNLWLAASITAFTLLMLAIALITSLYDAHLIGRAALHNEHLLQVNDKLRQESLQLEQANAQIRRQSEALEAFNRELENTVLRRTGELQESVRELEAFSHAVAHDLRAPLASIGGFCGLLAKRTAGRLSEHEAQYLTKISASVHQMADIIEGLLGLSRLSRIDLTHEPIDLSRMARDVLDDCQARAPERSLDASVHAGMQCQGDARLIRQVLVNLIGNAWKFSSRRGDAAIEVGMKPGPHGQPVFFVRDNGAGFDMAHAGKLFGHFQRLHGMAEFEGTGIGLATVQRIVLRHEGRVWAESAPGQGATFSFTLWQARDGAGAPAALPAAH